MRTIDSTKALGELIREVRIELNLSQAELALASGTGIRFISNIENGKPTCEIEKALRVAHMLGIRLEANPPPLSQSFKNAR